MPPFPALRRRPARAKARPPRAPAHLVVWRVVALFVTLSMVPVAVFAYFSLNLSDDAVRREVAARMRTTSEVSAAVLERQMEGLGELVESYARRPSLKAALADGDPAHFDGRVVEFHLRELRDSHPGVTGTFLADLTGRLSQVVPATPAIVGRDFSFRDWFKGVTRTGRPYVSEAYQSAIAGEPVVVAVADLVRAPSAEGQGRPLAILATVYNLEAIEGFAGLFSVAHGVRLTATDQRGVVLTSGGTLASSLVPRRDDPRVRAALGGRTGVIELDDGGERVLSAFAPVPGLGWTVTASIPTRTAFAAMRRLRSAVASFVTLLELLLLGGLAFLLRTLNRRRQAERTLRESEEHNRAILEAANDAFISMDGSGAITAWNSQARSLFGWTREEALGRPVAETIVPPPLREAHQQGLARFLATGQGRVLNRRVEVTGMHRDGRQFPVELGVWAAWSDAGYSFNAFVHDISGRKRNEAELAAARDQAMEASRMKSGFLANMSHEIRTPMNGVLGMTTLLLDTDLDDEQREYAETVRASGEALLDIINDILDFSKIEAGKLDFEAIDFDLRSLVEDVTQLLAGRAHDKGIELACILAPDVPTAVRGDPGRLRQILTNLVANAVKFTEQGEVVLRLRAAEEGDDAVVVHFEVVDTGIGIAAGDQVTMFQAFTQADASTTRKYGGTGLGLAICTQLVELMGGDIGVVSELGKGSTFWVRLPLRRAEAPASLPAPRADLQSLRVLIVDDNATNRTILEQFLASWGMAAESADGGAGALELLGQAASRGEPFDVAVLAMNMPGMDGLDLARAITAQPAWSRTRLVLLTSSGQRGEARVAAKVGVAAYLTKPVRQSQLFDCLTTVMGAGGPSPGPLVTRHRLAERSRTRGHLLVVEDNPVNQKVAVRLLENLGHRVDVAGNGAEAVEALARGRFSAVLMDCQMPVMDGFEATAEIRRLEGYRPRTPIIAMTASAMQADHDRCLAVGMDDFVTKPVRPDELAAVLERWVSPATAAPAPPPAEAPDAGGGEGVLDEEVLAGLRSLGDKIGEDLVGTLADLFLADAPLRLAALREAVGAGDPEGVSRAAHGLKGSSANLGARNVVRLCQTLEAAAGARDLGDASALVAELEAELARVRIAFTALAST